MSIQADTFDFVERCPTHKSTRLVLDDLLASVRKVGFDHLIVSGVPLRDQAVEPLVELNGWPKGWLERYADRGYAAIDGACRYSLETMNPYFWHDIPQRLRESAGSKLVANEATEFGLHSGYIVPTYSRLHWHSLVSFASSAKNLTLSTSEKTGLQLMAAMAMRAVENLRKPDTEARYLSPREREVLLWAARDKTAEETAAILSISVTTVRKHLQNARRTYGVASTLAAVAAALHRGQIVL